MPTSLFSVVDARPRRLYLDESGTLGYSGELFTMAMVMVDDLPRLEASTAKHRTTQTEVKASQMKTSQKLALAHQLIAENDLQVFTIRLDPLASMVSERKIDKELLYDSMVAQALLYYLEHGDLPQGENYRLSMDMRGGLRESYEDMVCESIGNVLMHREQPLVSSIDVRFLDSKYSAGVQAADLFSNIYRTALTSRDTACQGFLRKYAESGVVHAGFSFGLPELADQMTQIAADLRARVELERARAEADATSKAPADELGAPPAKAVAAIEDEFLAVEAEAAEKDAAPAEGEGGKTLSRSARRRRSRRAREAREQQEAKGQADASQAMDQADAAPAGDVPAGEPAALPADLAAADAPTTEEGAGAGAQAFVPRAQASATEAGSPTAGAEAAEPREAESGSTAGDSANEPAPTFDDVAASVRSRRGRRSAGRTSTSPARPGRGQRANAAKDGGAQTAPVADAKQSPAANDVRASYDPASGFSPLDPTAPDLVDLADATPAGYVPPAKEPEVIPPLADSIDVRPGRTRRARAKASAQKALDTRAAALAAKAAEKEPAVKAAEGDAAADAAERQEVAAATGGNAKATRRKAPKAAGTGTATAPKKESAPADAPSDAAAEQTAAQAAEQAAGQTAAQAAGQAAGQTAEQAAAQAAGQAAGQTAGQTVAAAETSAKPARKPATRKRTTSTRKKASSSGKAAVQSEGTKASDKPE